MNLNEDIDTALKMYRVAETFLSLNYVPNVQQEIIYFHSFHTFLMIQLNYLRLKLSFRLNNYLHSDPS